MLCSHMDYSFRCSLIPLCTLVLFLSLQTRAHADTLVDLELILAVDVSGSVDNDEYSLQMQGLSAAFRDPTVYAAIKRAGPNGIAVTVVQWSGPGEQAVAMDWFHLKDLASTNSFALQLQNLRRNYWGGDTLIGQAMVFAIRQFRRNGFTAPRQVIDVSGDGGVEALGMTRVGRDAAVREGIVVNGLAIEKDVTNLSAFYRDNVIGGAGSFVMTALNYRDFQAAIRRKLVEEIAPLQLSTTFPAKPAKGG